MYQTPGFIKNLVIFVAGAVFIGTDFFTTMNLNHLLQYLLGGYLVLSIYYGFLFGSEKYGNILSAVIFWLLPFSLVFAIGSSLIYGLVMSIPKFIISFFKWKRQRGFQNRWTPTNQSAYQSPQRVQSINQRTQPPRSQKGTNVVIFPRR
jgi:hypothetical protein